MSCHSRTWLIGVLSHDTFEAECNEGSIYLKCD
jgi:hypothetical protein